MILNVMKKRVYIFLGLFFLISATSVLSIRLSEYHFSSSKAIKSKENPIFSAQTDDKSWDNNNHVAGNCIIKGENNETFLFYYANSKKLGGNAIGLARSMDGIHFDRLDEPVLLPGDGDSWDNGGVDVFPNCIVKRNNGDYYMYFGGSKKDGTDAYHSGRIGIATSKDLIHWEKYEKNPILSTGNNEAWDSFGVFEPSVIFSGNEFGDPHSFKMWYGGSDKNMRFQIGYAESFDGFTWKKYDGNPVLSYSNKENEFDKQSIEVHSVTRFNNQYILFYEAQEEVFPTRFSIGVAFSQDGKEWHKSGQNPILEGGMPGSWDAMGAYHPSLVVDNDKLILYYVGLNWRYDHQIGVAELNPGYLFSK